MSERKPSPAERAAAMGEKARSQPPVDERRLGAMMDSSIRRYWYRITRPGGATYDVAFNPEASPSEAQAWFPDCEVRAP